MYTKSEIGLTLRQTDASLGLLAITYTKLPKTDQVPPRPIVLVFFFVKMGHLLRNLNLCLQLVFCLAVNVLLIKVQTRDKKIQIPISFYSVMFFQHFCFSPCLSCVANQFLLLHRWIFLSITLYQCIVLGNLLKRHVGQNQGLCICIRQVQ